MLATWEHDSAIPALHPEQYAEFILPSLSAMTQIEIKGSFICCECLTFPVAMYFSRTTQPWTLVMNPNTMKLKASKLLYALNCYLVIEAGFKD